MLMPQSDRKKIYERLFEDGVCIAKKDYQLKSHPEIEGVRNLYVIKALKVSFFTEDDHEVAQLVGVKHVKNACKFWATITKLRSLLASGV